MSSSVAVRTRHSPRYRWNTSSSRSLLGTQGYSGVFGSIRYVMPWVKARQGQGIAAAFDLGRFGSRLLPQSRRTSIQYPGQSTLWCPPALGLIVLPEDLPHMAKARSGVSYSTDSWQTGAASLSLVIFCWQKWTSFLFL